MDSAPAGLTVILVIFWTYCAIVFISSIYFWAKKTNRSQAPLHRRLIGLGYGLIWPIMLVRGVTGSGRGGGPTGGSSAKASQILDD